MTKVVPIENSSQVGLIVAGAVAIFIPTVFVILRLLAKRVGSGLDFSDYCILAALTFNTALQTDVILMVVYGGFGFHTMEIMTRFGTDTATFFFKGMMSCILIWNVTICLSKLSVLLMYTALLPLPSVEQWARGLGAFIIVWNIADIITVFLICRPLAKNWNIMMPGKCGNQPIFDFAMGIINIVVDIFLIILPIPYIYRLQMALRKKLLVMSLLSIGIMTWVITIYRQVSLSHMDVADMTHTGVLASLLSGLEPAVAIALACIPLLPPLFRGRNSTRKNSHYVHGSCGEIPNYSNKGNRGDDLMFTEIDDASEVQLRPLKPEQNVQVSACPKGNKDNFVKS